MQCARARGHRHRTSTTRTAAAAATDTGAVGGAQRAHAESLGDRGLGRRVGVVARVVIQHGQRGVEVRE